MLLLQSIQIRLLAPNIQEIIGTEGLLYYSMPLWSISDKLRLLFCTQDHYDHLKQNVDLEILCMKNLLQDIEVSIEPVEPKRIETIIKRLASNKAADIRGITAEDLKFGGKPVFQHISFRDSWHVPFYPTSVPTNGTILISLQLIIRTWMEMFLVLHLTGFTFHDLSVLLGPVPLLKISIFVIERSQKNFFNRVTDLINFGKQFRSSIIEIFLLLASINVT